MPYRRLVLWSPHDADVYAATSPVDLRLFRTASRSERPQLLGVAPMAGARALAWHPAEARVLAAAGPF